MTKLNRVLKSDFIKIKRTPLLYIHIIIPIIGIIAFFTYFTLSSDDAYSKIVGYFQVLSFIFPIVISIICAMIAEQEISAGYGYNLLTNTSPKILSCVSKIILLSILGLLSTIVAICGFGISINFILNQSVFTISFYFKTACIIFASNLSLYLLHIFISLHFGKGASISLGVIGVLISALMITGLGDDIWYFIPYAWGIRFATIWTSVSVGNNVIYIQPNISFIVLFAIIVTLIMLALLLLWFWLWEGRKLYD